MTNLVPRTVGFLTEIQTWGFSKTSSKPYVLEKIRRQRDEIFFYYNIFTPHSGSWLLFFFCRILLAALKASVENSVCFEE